MMFVLNQRTFQFNLDSASKRSGYSLLFCSPWAVAVIGAITINVPTRKPNGSKPTGGSTGNGEDTHIPTSPLNTTPGPGAGRRDGGGASSGPPASAAKGNGPAHNPPDRGAGGGSAHRHGGFSDHGVKRAGAPSLSAGHPAGNQGMFSAQFTTENRYLLFYTQFPPLYFPSGGGPRSPIQRDAAGFEDQLIFLPGSSHSRMFLDTFCSDK